MLLQFVRWSITLRFSLSILYHPMLVPWFYQLSFASGTCEILRYSFFGCCPVLSNALVWTCFWNEVVSSQNAHNCVILPPIFQSWHEQKFCHNCWYSVWMFLLHFHKEHVSIKVDCSVILQVGHSNGILRSCHAGCILLFCLKLYSWRLVRSWYFLWAFYFHVVDCMRFYDFRYLYYYVQSFF